MFAPAGMKLVVRAVHVGPPVLPAAAASRTSTTTATATATTAMVRCHDVEVLASPPVRKGAKPDGMSGSQKRRL